MCACIAASPRPTPPPSLPAQGLKHHAFAVETRTRWRLVMVCARCAVRLVRNCAGVAYVVKGRSQRQRPACLPSPIVGTERAL